MWEPPTPVSYVLGLQATMYICLWVSRATLLTIFQNLETIITWVHSDNEELLIKTKEKRDY